MTVTGSAPAAASSLGFRPGLDGVRAVAVLAVIAYHLDAPWMRGGFLGVDLFMVLSGYLITSLLLLELDRTGRVSLRAFWARRVRRIVPAVVVVVLALAGYAAVMADPVERVSLRWDTLAALTSWANWRFVVDGSGYWAQFGAPSPVTHFWSLSVEEQFYLAWPPVLFGLVIAARGRRLVPLVATVIAIAASATAMALLHDAAAPSRAYLGTDTRVQTLLFGALGALVLRPAPDRRAVTTGAAAAVGTAAAVLVVAALVLVDDQSVWMYRGGFALFAAAGLAMVVAAGETAGPVRSSLGWAPLVWIGRRSFGWYLWHWPLIVALTPERLGFDGAMRVVVIVVLTVAFAEMSYQFVEQPVRSGALRWRLRPAVLPMATVGAVAATAALLVVATRVPMPERPDLTVADLAPVAAVDESAIDAPAIERPPPDPSSDPPVILAPAIDEPVVSPRGSTDAPVSSAAMITADVLAAGTPPEPPEPPEPSAAVSSRPVTRVVIQGDSVALFSSLPMVEAFAAAGISVENRTFAGQSLANPVVLDVVEQSDADLSIWQLSLWDVGDPDEVRANHERFVEVSLAAGADVVFVDRPPVRDELETVERQWPRQLARELADAHPGRVHLIDTEALWSAEVVIDADGDGLPERFRDGVHVCPQGAARFTAWLLDELAWRYEAVVPGDPAVWIDGGWLDDPNWASNPGECDPL